MDLIEDKSVGSYSSYSLLSEPDERMHFMSAKELEEERNSKRASSSPSVSSNNSSNSFTTQKLISVDSKSHTDYNTIIDRRHWLTEKTQYLNTKNNAKYFEFLIARETALTEREKQVSEREEALKTYIKKYGLSFDEIKDKIGSTDEG